MVSQTTRYALQILGYLAGRGEDRVPGEEIAQATSASNNMFTDIPTQTDEVQIDAAPDIPAPVSADPTAIPEPGTMFEEISEPTPTDGSDEAAPERAPTPRAEAPAAPADFLEPTSLEATLDAAEPVAEPVPEPVADDDGFVTDPAVAAPVTLS